MVLAQEQARLLNHNYIGTEHLLLGLLSEGEGVAARALVRLGVDLDRTRAAVERRIGRGGSAPTGHVPFTPRAKTVLELSLREALQLGHNYIGTEHVLLGLVHEGQGVASQVLHELGLELNEVRNAVIELLSGLQPSAAPHEPQPVQPTCPHCRGPLDGRIGTKSLSATRDEEGGVDPVVVVYCRTCGSALGVIAGASLT